VIIRHEHTDRRIMRLPVTPEMLVLMCRSNEPWQVIGNALPDDARAVGSSYDAMRNCFQVFIHSAAYELVPEFEEVPEVAMLTFKRWDGMK